MKRMEIGRVMGMSQRAGAEGSCSALGQAVIALRGRCFLLGTDGAKPRENSICSPLVWGMAGADAAGVSAFGLTSSRKFLRVEMMAFMVDCVRVNSYNDKWPFAK